ncbi:cupin domain-containing protein [Hippea jasoniae]|uniref:cupin domain-containing protein n=1 Tax=Hippea jasoniae TaxID=944479 RepID=UPI00054D7873|nr:cupin domain-containing protein [Hippea jasoniae]
MNVFEGIEIGQKGEEIIETITKSENVKIERIVSYNSFSKKGFYYDNDEYEFVILLYGEAKLYLESKGMVKLKSGDYMIIEPHDKHSVEYTSNPAVWLCIYYK